MIAVGRLLPVPLVGQAGLLLVLVGHLLPMASPLHAATVHGEAGGVAHHAVGHAASCPTCVDPQIVAAETPDRAGDCAFETVLRPASGPFRLAVCQVLVAWQEAVQGPLARSSWLLARERPLRLTSTQDFLQVFRT